MATKQVVCPRTPEDIRRALERKPEWLQGFQQEWMAAATDFSGQALDEVLDRWHPFAVACATPGHMDEVEDLARRVRTGDTEGIVFYDADGRAWTADNERVPERDAAAETRWGPGV